MVRLLAVVARSLGAGVPDDHVPPSESLAGLATVTPPSREARRAEVLAFAARHGGEA